MELIIFVKNKKRKKLFLLFLRFLKDTHNVEKLYNLRNLYDDILQMNEQEYITYECNYFCYESFAEHFNNSSTFSKQQQSGRKKQFSAQFLHYIVLHLRYRANEYSSIL